MCDDKKKMCPKKETGTVPKLKYRNKNDPQFNYQNVPTKNLIHMTCVRDSSSPADQSKFYTNSELQKKNILRANYCLMETTDDEQNAMLKQNSTACISNGSISSRSTSASESRRNSVGTVCSKSDNVTKYPDKKQIEEKLNQIREYIQVTSSLMANMKNTDDQSNRDEVASLEELIDNLKDSERKLLTTLCAIESFEVEQANTVSENKEHDSENGVLENTPDVYHKQNDIEKRVLLANREIEKLHQDNILLNLQIKAENQMRNAIKVQQKLAQQTSKELNRSKNSKFEEELLREHSSLTEQYGNINGNGNKHLNGVQYDQPKEPPGERLKHLNDSHVSISSSIPSGSNSQESLMSQIDSLNQKIGYFHDANDQGIQLIQILDNQDVQLQNAHHQLQSKLKDLQEKKIQVDNLVSQLEIMNEESEEDDVREQIRKIVSMKNQLKILKQVVKNTESLIETQQQNFKNKTAPEIKIESNKGHKMNQKQINKTKINSNERERMKLQVELQAKKRELEELMFKHKAVTSNLNQDFHNENKSEHILLENESNTWYPAPNVYNLPASSEYSSDDCADEDLSQVNSIDNNKTMHVPPMPSLNYMTSNYIKHDIDGHLDMATEYSHASLKAPDNARNSVPVMCPREASCANNGKEIDKHQIQKQLELIRSVCDTMLDEQNSTTGQVRNNLTPSSLYSEPRQYGSINLQNMNSMSHQNETIPFPIQNMPSTELNYQNWLTTNTLQTQAFMLNTLNQCCQMLWLQQREIASLRNTVNMIHDRLPNVQCDPNVASYLTSTNQLLNVDATSRQNIPNLRSSASNPKANQVSSATSMPNLNQMQIPPTNIDTTSAFANNLHNTRLIDSSLNNSTFAGVSNTVLHGANHQQVPPSQIWNGQAAALNNQVAPGNRANNYWDNFRSYSRQNLLSTKSNDGLQNLCSVQDSSSRGSSCTDRSHYNSYTFQPTAPVATISLSKTNVTNSLEAGANISVDNNPRCAMFKVPSTHIPNANNTLTNVPPPDVLNVNQIQNAPLKCNDELVEDVLQVQLPLLNPDHAHNDTTIGNLYESATLPVINRTSDHLKNWRSSLNRQINRNEWHEETRDNSTVKSKLFEALRENVYKEVASLISANQGRPHFLIQLFRDLQLISSDPLRRQTLQSIQSLITQSICSGSTTAHTFDNQAPLAFTDASFVFQNHLPEYLTATVCFLNKHAEEKLNNDLLDVFKKLLIDTTFAIMFTNIKDEEIRKHFLNLISETLEQFRNKTIKDVKVTLLHTIEELYRGKISFLHLMRENFAEIEIDNTVSGGGGVSFDVSLPKVFDTNSAPQQIQNADLAEADQSRIDVDDEDECDDDNNEGAVGGLVTDRSSNNSNHINNCDESDNKIEYPIDAEADAEITEGLDQVPTRLSQSLRMSSVSLNREHPNSSKPEM